MVEVALKHRKHPHYTTTVASGLGIGGPSTDGFVSIAFFREMVDVVEEYFDRIEEPLAGGAVRVTMNSTAKPAKIEQFREDVATVLVPIASFYSFAEAVANMAESLRKAEAMSIEGLNANG